MKLDMNASTVHLKQTLARYLPNIGFKQKFTAAPVQKGVQLRGPTHFIQKEQLRTNYGFA